jgi:uncharacterized protein (TIGR02246 family)
MSEISLRAQERRSAAAGVVRAMCDAYEQAVNAGDSAAYAQLFAPEAVRVPPGTLPEHGPDAIRRGEQADYDVTALTITSTPEDVLEIADGWIYALAYVDGTNTARADGTTSSFRVTKSWLLHRQLSGEWVIMRQMWNQRPAET